MLRLVHYDSFVLGYLCLLVSQIKTRNDPVGIRTPVTGVKGQCPKPLDDGAAYLVLGRVLVAQVNHVNQHAQSSHERDDSSEYEQQEVVH